MFNRIRSKLHKYQFALVPEQLYWHRCNLLISKYKMIVVVLFNPHPDVSTCGNLLFFFTTVLPYIGGKLLCFLIFSDCFLHKPVQR